MPVSFDESLLRLCNGWASQPAIAQTATHLSSWLPLVFSLVAASILLVRSQPRALIVVFLAMGVGDALTARVLKPTFDRNRPCHVLSDLEGPVPCGSGRSMPSGHATVAFSFLAAIVPALRRRPAWIFVFTMLAVLVAGSRVVLGVHYPSDVMAGALVGSAVGLVTQRVLIKKSKNRRRFCL